MKYGEEGNILFIFTAKLTRKRAALYVIAAGALVALLILGIRQAHSTPPPQGDAVSFLQSYGWEVSPEPIETLQLLLEPDEAYAALQKTQGFDWEAYQGQRAERVTYRVTNYPGIPETVQANLYLCDGVIVAGDIFVAGENGFQAGLAFPSP
ncbi:MAG: DUF4830 domain-containing protein [Oscillospiraceae bacterium]